jgi:hypothetical protein
LTTVNFVKLSPRATLRVFLEHQEATMKSDHKIETDVRDEFDNSFDVPAPPAEVWPVLSDIRRIASCITGVELTGTIARYGHSVGVIRATAAQIMTDFATNLRGQILTPAGG